MNERNEDEPGVGVGTEPGNPPSVGTGERTHKSSAPPTGRVDAERATWGTSNDMPASVTDDAVVRNVGAPEGDRPDQPIADFPEGDPKRRAGIDDTDGAAR